MVVLFSLPGNGTSMYCVSRNILSKTFQHRLKFLQNFPRRSFFCHDFSKLSQPFLFKTLAKTLPKQTTVPNMFHNLPNGSCFFPNQACLKGFLLTIKESVQVAQPSGSPKMCRAVPPVDGTGSPSMDRSSPARSAH